MTSITLENDHTNFAVLSAYEMQEVSAGFLGLIIKLIVEIIGAPAAVASVVSGGLSLLGVNLKLK